MNFSAIEYLLENQIYGAFHQFAFPRIDQVTLSKALMSKSFQSSKRTTISLNLAKNKRHEHYGPTN